MHTNAKSHACPKATPNATLHMVHQLGDLFSWDALGKIFEELKANELVLNNRLAMAGKNGRILRKRNPRSTQKHVI